LILIGGEIILGDASEKLLEFVKVNIIPVCTTLMGKGAISKEHPLGLGMLGLNGIESKSIAHLPIFRKISILIIINNIKFNIIKKQILINFTNINFLTIFLSKKIYLKAFK